VPGSPWCLGMEGAPLGQQSWVCSQTCPTAPGREQGRLEGSQGSASIGHLHGAGMGQGWPGTLVWEWAWFCGAHSSALQGCNELETRPAVVSLWQEMTVLGARNGVLGPGPAQGRPEGGRGETVKADSSLSVLPDGPSGTNICLSKV